MNRIGRLGGWMFLSGVMAMSVGAGNELQGAVGAGEAGMSLRSEDQINLARGRAVRFHQAPNYALCTDAEDAIQLTDGVIHTGPGTLWVQQGTVGWRLTRPIVMTLDLGAVEPIAGVAVRSAAGHAGVGWPLRILVLVSDDGQAFHHLGDLVRDAQAAPPAEGYAVHWYAHDQWQSHGRYVQLVVEAEGNLRFFFTDEIEVYRGQDAWRDRPLPGAPIHDAEAYFEQLRLREGVARRIETDRQQVADQIAASSLSEERKQAMGDSLETIRQAMQATPEMLDQAGPAVLPLNPLHRQVFEVHGSWLAAVTAQPLVLRAANPWRYLAPVAEPAGSASGAEASVALMRGEKRSVAIDLVNQTQQVQHVALSVADLPASVRLRSVREAVWTDTAEGLAIASALRVIDADSGRYIVEVPVGMTRQVHLDLAARRDVLAPGVASAQVVAEILDGPHAASWTLPLKIRLFDLDLPAAPTVHIGGWDYTDRAALYGVTPANREALVTLLQRYDIDTTWATAEAMPWGVYDAAGRMIQAPDTTSWDDWVARWPSAARYAVFMRGGATMAGHPVGSELAGRVAEQWVRFWSEHLQRQGIEPQRVLLHFIDEPHPGAQMDLAIAWGQAMRQAGAPMTLWSNPIVREPGEVPQALLEAYDVLCFRWHEPFGLTSPFHAFFAAQRAAGRRLELYVCDGPVKDFDPYTYFRLQIWACFQIGAEAASYWAFGGTGGASDWLPYHQVSASYTPLFLDETSVMPAKPLEAIRAGVQDHAYLTMLAQAAERLETAGDPRAAEARALLAGVVTEVLTAPGATERSWMLAKDHGAADAGRERIGEFLEGLIHAR